MSEHKEPLAGTNSADHAASHDSEELEQEQEAWWEELSSRFLMFQVMPSWLSSFLIHLVVILLLALFTWELPRRTMVSLVASEGVEEIDSLTELNFDSVDSSDALSEHIEFDESTDDLEEASEFMDTFQDDLMSMTPALSEPIHSLSDLESAMPLADGLPTGIHSQLSGRSGAGRKKAIQSGGATAESENAVELALEWLAKHQMPNGSWNFNHQIGPGNHRTSPNPGQYSRARFAATSMALLAFLGAGETHVHGKYQEVVSKGLEFLLGSEGGVNTKNGLSFWEEGGRMYSHGLAAICICEAYAMTDDSRLRNPAQEVLRFIEYAQDPLGGGWRYEPQEVNGDTSVVGWQVMALKSANLKNLEVSDETIRKTKKFLDFVSAESGTYYGYQRPPRQREKALTAVGLLCRMYLGWGHENPSLARGVQYLADVGPSVGDWEPGDARGLSNRAKSRKFECNLYYNYYATQVMRHYGGADWEAWNKVMRDFLVETQATDGVAKGSWFFEDGDELGAATGGRLYATTMAVMTLEVYYRYLPLYDNEKIEDSDFSLD